MTEMDDGYDLRRLQQLQLDILKEVKRVCEKKNFTFYIMNGTCLGAVRHHGPIPWDDDMDIGMYAEDFDRFVECRDEFDDKYFIQTVETDPEFRTMIARVRMNGTTVIEEEFQDCAMHHGVFIDVYPLFGYPKNKAAGRIRSWQSLLYRLLLAEDAPKNHGRGAKAAGNLIHRVLPSRYKKRLLCTIPEKMRSEPKDSRYVAFLYGMDVRLFHTIKYERSWFGVPEVFPYEDILLPAPTDWDSYLRIRYNDYMCLPPEEERSPHHSFLFIDTDHSYLDFMGTEYLTGRRSEYVSKERK